jgi:hypothetical protein
MAVSAEPAPGHCRGDELHNTAKPVLSLLGSVITQLKAFQGSEGTRRLWEGDYELLRDWHDIAEAMEYYCGHDYLPRGAGMSKPHRHQRLNISLHANAVAKMTFSAEGLCNHPSVTCEIPAIL